MARDISIWYKVCPLTRTMGELCGEFCLRVDRYSHIAAEKLEQILAACKECESWLADLLSKQEAMPKYQKPILTCVEMEKRTQN